MSESEKIEMYIACCLACLLAEYMKDCQHCKFNCGLKVKNPGIEN